ncbi:MamI family restriction endonuclease [Nocardioides bizhenqiangii]|uniref:MamI family restriction endonuclease n=1 Tax=Nocardioides bizhenqiangii TaxID=3095076 RepID=A0ABZ0ZSE4_9ACTN|nr:MamI family restriction endonuclease [Nocardioides sp. HM61]WQQ26826.1 MamI family restriction endonuclease [Nocardioides sp. HM61]
METVRDLADSERERLCARLLQQQVVDQRRFLHYWRDLTLQPAQIDTGYIGQMLVSLVTGLVGGGMRGKGLDMEDGSEIKSANFLDSLDRRGAAAPRWNFQANNLPAMEALLDVPAIYLCSIDVNLNDKVRVRVWRLRPAEHRIFAERYIRWIEDFGKPKLADPRRPNANFQVFPPRPALDHTYARHGGGNVENGLPALMIELEDGVGAEKIFHAEEDRSGTVTVELFAP